MLILHSIEKLYQSWSQTQSHSNFLLPCLRCKNNQPALLMQVPAKVHLRWVLSFGYAVIKMDVLLGLVGQIWLRMQPGQELEIISTLWLKLTPWSEETDKLSYLFIKVSLANVCNTIWQKQGELGIDLFHSAGSDTASLNSKVFAVNYCRGYFQVSVKQVLPWWGKFECIQVNVRVLLYYFNFVQLQFGISFYIGTFCR